MVQPATTEYVSRWSVAEYNIIRVDDDDGLSTFDDDGGTGGDGLDYSTFDRS